MTNIANITNTAKAKLANLLGLKISQIKHSGVKIDAIGKLAYINLRVGDEYVTHMELPIKDGSYSGWAGCENYGTMDKNGFVKISSLDIINKLAQAA